MIKYVECSISSERYPIDDCHPYGGGKVWASKAVMSHYGKMKTQMHKKGLSLQVHQYREFMGYPSRGVYSQYPSPSNNELQSMTVFLNRELE